MSRFGLSSTLDMSNAQKRLKGFYELDDLLYFQMGSAMKIKRIFVFLITSIF